MDQKLLKKMQEAREKWAEATPGSKEEKKCLDEWESCSSRLLVSAKTEKDLELVFKTAPASGPTENAARDQIDDLNLQLAKDQVELLQARKEWHKALGDDKKVALDKLKELCLRILAEAKFIKQVELVLPIARECGLSFFMEALETMMKLVRDISESLESET